MAAVAKAYSDRSLQGFQAALEAHREQLAGDPVVHTHLQVLPLLPSTPWGPQNLRCRWAAPLLMSNRTDAILAWRQWHREQQHCQGTAAGCHPVETGCEV